MKIHHIGIIVDNIYKNLEIFVSLGYSCTSNIVIDKIQNNKIVFLQQQDDCCKIELIQPLNEHSTVYNFPCGLHHLCYEVKCDYNTFAESFKKMKIGKIFTRPICAPAINNRQVVFAYTKANNILELLF